MQKLRYLLLLSSFGVAQTASAKPQVVIDDEFNGNTNNWPLYNTDRFKTAIQNGSYEMYAPKGLQMVTKATTMDFERDFRLSAKIRLTAGPQNKGFGISFAARSSRYAYYFYIAANGHYKLAYFDDRPAQDVIAWKKSPHVRTGHNQDNDLTIERHDGNWIFYINGREVERIRALRGFGNRIGFGVAGEEMAASVTSIRALQFVPDGAPDKPVAIAPPPPAPPPLALNGPPHVAPGPPGKAARRIVAVFDIEDRAKKLKRDDVEQLTEYLEALVAEKGHYAIVPRATIKRTIAGAKKQTYDACYDEACQIELGKAVAAEAILTTKVVKLGSRCAVTTSLFDLEKEVTLTAATERGACGTDDLVALLDKVAKRI